MGACCECAADTEYHATMVDTKDDRKMTASKDKRCGSNEDDNRGSSILLSSLNV
jgi:hypothetical protein